MPAAASFGRNAPVVRHLHITGVVQGVYYRAGLSSQAEALGVCGWVRNRLDGSVEAVACGSATAMRALIDWAQKGPPNARVHRVSVHPADNAEATDVYIGFEQRESI